MAKKNKKEQVVAPVKKPSVVSLNPLNIVQPVDVCQTFKTVATAWEEPVEEPVVVHKCSVRKAQRFFGILSILVVIAAFVFGGFLAPAFVENMVNVYTKIPCGMWGTADWALYIGTFVAAALIVSILLRWVFHSIGCKARRRNKRCCRRCEFYRFAWTFVVVALAGFIGMAYGFAATNFLGFTDVYNNLVEVINGILANGFVFTNPKHFVGACGLGIIVALFVLFVILTLAHKARDRKRAKYAA